jgi:hypothetical protein
MESSGKTATFISTFPCKFHDERVPSRQTVYNLLNNVRTTRSLIDKKQKPKGRVFTEEKLDDRGARLEHTPRKSLKRLLQETGVSKPSARRATQLLKRRRYKTTVIHARLAGREPASGVHLCSWFVQFVVEGEIDPQLTLFSDEAWFHFHVCVNTQNNRYWSSQKPRLIQEVPLYPVKIGIWCSVKDCWTCFFNKKIN